MNLLEALKSGLKFRRPTGYHIGSLWYSRLADSPDGVAIVESDDPTQYWALERDDLLANDWETQEETLTLTFGQFSDVLNGRISPDSPARGVAIDIRKDWELAALSVATRRRNDGTD